MKRIKILVIDDDESLRRVLEYNLAQEGYAVLTAASGEQGLEFLKKEGADLVLTDVRMPGMSGLEALRQARKEHAVLPVLLVTAFADIREAVGAQGANIDGVSGATITSEAFAQSLSVTHAIPPRMWRVISSTWRRNASS